MRYLSSGGKSLTEPPFHRFFEFIAPSAKRFEVLQSLLPEMGLHYMVFPVAGNRHFFIFPPGMGLPFRDRRPSMVLAAHYDRAPGSPGANDNSAAVFLLLRAAKRCSVRGRAPWMIILTDKEELREGQGLREQGAYSLGESLRRSGIKRARLFIFDACGAGDTLIISTGTDRLLQNETGPGAVHIRFLIQDLRNRALQSARNIGLNRVLLLPTPFSDDAGFLRSGIAAQTITALPRKEASAFAALIRARPELAGALISREQAEGNTELFPATWRRLNSPGDTHYKLSPEYFDMISRFAGDLLRG
ncbi:MAG: M28 family peptidase [Treponema sp.]|jgi:hypothetical protein|nr:M28 family peptidase [Treponema sp.]